MRRSRKPFPEFFGTGVRIPPFPHLMRKFMKIFIALLFVSTLAFSQTENWVLVIAEDVKSVYLNSVGLNIYQEGDIFVWVKEEYSKAIRMEEIDEKIFLVKSFYMINREILKYSLMEVIYYDQDKNVIKNYSYNRNYDNPQYKYSSPIISNSDMEKVLVKCEEIIKVSNNQ